MLRKYRWLVVALFLLAAALLGGFDGATYRDEASSLFRVAVLIAVFAPVLLLAFRDPATRRVTVTRRSMWIATALTLAFAVWPAVRGDYGFAAVMVMLACLMFTTLRPRKRVRADGGREGNNVAMSGPSEEAGPAARPQPAGGSAGAERSEAP